MVAHVDPDRLQQIIANLIENAMKFARSTVRVSVVGGAGSAPAVEVSNDGPGIDAVDLPHVFERLYVAAAAPVRKETGSGLGLAIVRELADAMGGAVEVSSPPGGWTTFRVTLSATPPPPLSPPSADRP